MSLFDAVAYFAELIDTEGNAETAAAIPAATYDESRDLVRIRVDDISGGIVVLLASRERAFVITAGPETGESILVFGDGVEGARPADGATVTYEQAAAQGAGATGNVAISGLRLAHPLLLVAFTNARGCARIAHLRLDAPVRRLSCSQDT